MKRGILLFEKEEVRGDLHGYFWPIMNPIVKGLRSANEP
jgi:hypothetical protein